jgi:hypothetical protein
MKAIVFITDNITGSIYISFAYCYMKIAETGANFSRMRKAKVLGIFLIHVIIRDIGVNLSCASRCELLTM